MTPEERRLIVTGEGYVNPLLLNFGSGEMVKVEQSVEDVTMTYTVQQVALLAKRVAMLEAQNELLWTLLKPDL